MRPSQVFFTKGVGHHTERLAAFELALRDAGIEQFNLITVSSILPTGCTVIDREVGLGIWKSFDGMILPVVLARCEVDEQFRVASAAIGMAYPKDGSHYGYLSEVHEPGMSEEEAGEYAEDLAMWMLLTCRGHKLEEEELDEAWNSQREIWKVNNTEYETDSCAVSAPGKKDEWTAAVAAAVFLE